MDTIPDSGKGPMQCLQRSASSPEHEALNSEIRRPLEQEIDALPDNYRTIFVLCDVEDVGVGEVAEILDISPENVKTLLHRAHALLRKRLYQRTGAQSHEAFLFRAPRCDRVVKTVFARIEGQ
jgi:RNA polymerase sigma-70 factor, ECF subfamily